MRGYSVRNTAYGLAGLLLSLPGLAAATDMKPMSDQEMSEVNGQGVGIVMEDFRFAHGHDAGTFRLTGITNEAGGDVTVLVDKLYIGGTGSGLGSSLQTVNLGRLVNPFSMQVRDGDDIGPSLSGKAIFELAAPRKGGTTGGEACLPGGSDTNCSSRASERMDFGIATTVQSGGSSSNVNIHAESAVVDGSYIRLWGSAPGDSRQQLRGQIQSNLYTSRLSINACQGAGSCGSSIAFNDFIMELTLGNTYQPLFMEVTPDQGQLRFEMESIGQVDNVDYQDYYTNDAYRSSVSAGEVEVGGQSLGSAKMEGMLFQKLETTTRNLD